MTMSTPTNDVLRAWETTVPMDGAAADTNAQPPTPQPNIKADTVNLTGNANQVEARLVNVDHGNIGQAKAETMTITLTNGSIGAMAAKHTEVMVKDGGIGAMAAQQADVRDTVVSVLAAAKVNLSGNARVLVDMRAGMVFGVIVGTLLSLSNLVLRRQAKRALAVASK